MIYRDGHAHNLEKRIHVVLEIVMCKVKDRNVIHAIWFKDWIKLAYMGDIGTTLRISVCSKKQKNGLHKIRQRYISKGYISIITSPLVYVIEIPQRMTSREISFDKK